jgi:transporter family-2 protein
MGASVLLDAVGGLGVPARPLSFLRAVGVVVVLAGVVALVRGSGEEWSARADARWWALGLLAGAVLPLQGAVNAALRADLDAPLAAASVSFVVGTLVLAGSAGALLATGRAAWPRAGDFGAMPWWAWLGGLLGAAYVLSVLVLIPEQGAAVTIGLAVAGQQLASLVIDRYGLVRLPRRSATVLRVSGALALLLGVLLVQVGGR